VRSCRLRLQPIPDAHRGELEGTYPDTAVVVTYRYKPRCDPKQEELRAPFPIWSDEEPYFQAGTVKRRDVERGWGTGSLHLVHRARWTYCRAMRPDQLERRLRAHLDALGPAPRAELLHALMLPNLERAERIGEFWSYPQSRAFAELLIDCEEDRTPRATA
jgi:hypothetical protein